MGWPTDTVLRFLSHDWAGLAIAGSLLGIAILLLRHLRLPALLLSGVALVLAAGAISHMVAVRQFHERHPPPGRILEVQGMTIHLLAEGQGRPTIIMFGGGHAAGASLMHLHRALRSDHRSILIDRPATGWSGPARFPLSTALEADLMWAVLDKAGEKGPFVLAGHSFGGLLAANMARRRPASVHALVLLDPTPPDAIVYGPLLGDLSSLRREPFRRGLLALFGVDHDTLFPPDPVPPAYQRIDRIVAGHLGEAGTVMKAQADLPRSHMAAASIYRELSPVGMAEAGWDTALFDGELDGTPVYLVAPQTQVGIELLAEVQNAGQGEALRMQRFFAVVRERAMAMSNRSTRVVAPPETGHNFIYEDPGFTLEAIRAAAR